MKIVKFKGGLGNQMFQYAFAKALRKETGDEVRLDFSAYESLHNDSVRRPRVERFKLSLKSASESDIKKICMFPHKGNSQSLMYKMGIYLEKTLNGKYIWEETRAFTPMEKLVKYDYFDGYWQSYRYVDTVKNELKKDFIPEKLSDKTLETIKRISGQNAVFVGIRKGDYTESRHAQRHFGSFSVNYYLSAMEKISETVENPVFYIFTNDTAWCKKNMDFGEYNVIYREKEDQTDDFEELILMSSCKHAIIINSTYHWWGAYLIENKDKKVYCPKKWFFDDKPIDIIPHDWKVIKTI